MSFRLSVKYCAVCWVSVTVCKHAGLGEPTSSREMISDTVSDCTVEWPSVNETVHCVMLWTCHRTAKQQDTVRFRLVLIDMSESMIWSALISIGRVQFGPSPPFPCFLHKTFIFVAFSIKRLDRFHGQTSSMQTDMRPCGCAVSTGRLISHSGTEMQPFTS